MNNIIALQNFLEQQLLILQMSISFKRTSPAKNSDDYFLKKMIFF